MKLQSIAAMSKRVSFVSKPLCANGRDVETAQYPCAP